MRERGVIDRGRERGGRPWPGRQEAEEGVHQSISRDGTRVPIVAALFNQAACRVVTPTRCQRRCPAASLECISVTAQRLAAAAALAEARGATIVLAVPRTWINLISLDWPGVWFMRTVWLYVATGNGEKLWCLGQTWSPVRVTTAADAVADAVASIS